MQELCLLMGQVVAHGAGLRSGLGEWEPEPRLVGPEVLSEDICCVLNWDIVGGAHGEERMNRVALVTIY